jgi:hypothetical protein
MQASNKYSKGNQLFQPLLPVAKEAESSVLVAKQLEFGAKTLSLESAGSGGQDMEKLETSSMGTSTALAMQATPTELVYENIVSLIKGPLVNINKDV